MGSIKSFILGAVFSTLVFTALTACKSAPIFPYKYYALDAVSYDGTLKGPTPDKDINLKECAPTADNKAPCMVLFTYDLLDLKKEYKQLQYDLYKCQQGN